MNFKNLISLLTLSFLLIASVPSVAGGPERGKSKSTFAQRDSLSQRQVQNLFAFAKVYGYIKYFYPLNKKERINWRLLASQGAQTVIDANSDEELRDDLISFFGPVAPLLVIQHKASTGIAAENKGIISKSGSTRADTHYYYNLHQGLGQDKEDLPLITRKISKAIYKSITVDVDEKRYQELIAKGTILPVDSTYSASLSENLTCSFPIVVTETAFKANHAHKLFNRNYKLDIDSHPDRIATMVIFWNVIQHFYPYLEQAENWNAVFFRTATQLTPSISKSDFFNIMSTFRAALKDGHATLSYRNKIGIYRYAAAPAIQTAWVENELVISKVNVLSSEINPGDILERINSKSAGTLAAQAKERLSIANKQNADLLAGESILNWVGTTDSLLLLELTDSTGKQKVVQLDGKSKLKETVREPVIKKLEGDLYLIDAARVDAKEIEQHLQTLKQAKGLIFDLRSRPSNSFLSSIIPYLIKEEVETGNWAIPHYTFPDQQQVDYQQTSKWHIKPNGNYLNANLVFLIGHHTISYGETCAELISHYKLGTTMGHYTAGTNGNINFSGAGKLQLVWTGMQVLKRDGSLYHGIGVEPDILISQRIEDIRAGKDTEVEAAVKHLKELTLLRSH